MGCGASTDQGPSGRPQNGAAHNPKKEDPQEVMKSSGIDRDLDRARQNEELKVKLLLLGAGESGKSTIFKQMRILHGAPRTEEDQRMYGVVIRSNVITAMRKLCSHLRSLGLEGQLAKEPKSDDSDFSPKAAYDLIVAHVVDNTASPTDLPIPPENSDGKDWVGQSPRAGLGANNDAKQFLQLWRAIKALWEVSDTFLRYLLYENYPFIETHLLLYTNIVKDNEGSLVKTCSGERHRWSQGLLARPCTHRLSCLSSDNPGHPSSACQDNTGCYGEVSN